MVRVESASRATISPVPWWLVMLEGIAAILVGLMFFSAPGATTLLLVQIIGWYWLISGIFSIVSIFIDLRQWGWKLLSGILGVIAGFVIIQHPLWSAIAFPAAYLTVLAIGGLIIGISKLFQAFTGAGWGTGLLGLLSIIFGVLILVSPSLGAVSFLVVFPAVAVIGGIVSVIAAFQMRRIEPTRVRAPYPSAVPVTGDRTRESEEHAPDEPSDRIG
jgi:uncharacterized membrane protein HdeD (DUF308 family)